LSYIKKYDARSISKKNDDEVVSNVAAEDATIYVGVYGYSETSTYKLYITCEGLSMTCEELWKTSFNDMTYLDVDMSGGIRLDNSVADGEN
jgi:hypothetical protein